VVLFEDASDLLGLLIAFLGVFLSHLLKEPLLDGVASVLIGLLLLVVAGLLLRETKSLLLGEPAEEQLLRNITALVQAESAVISNAPPLSSYLSPHELLVILPVEFAAGLPAAQLTKTIERLRATITAAYPDVRHIFIQPTSSPKNLD
jgi:divalent metal cation (Fe/Co/Zn/Cd) transporter